MSFSHRRKLCQIAVDNNRYYSSWIQVAEYPNFISEYITKLIASDIKYKDVLMINCMGEDKIIEYNMQNRWENYKQKLEPHYVLSIALRRNTYNFDMDKTEHNLWMHGINFYFIDIKDDKTISSTEQTTEVLY